MLTRGRGYLTKHLMLYPGEQTSLQQHTHRDEMWRVLAGIGLISVAGEHWTIKCGDNVTISKYSFHRVKNIGKEILLIYEVQIGDILSEDDIIRIEDDYGRI